MRGMGTPHLEQIAAISYTDGVIVSELLPGKDGMHLTAVDRAKITDAQIAELADTLTQAEQAGVVLDLSERVSAANLFTMNRKASDL